MNASGDSYRHAVERILAEPRATEARVVEGTIMLAGRRVEHAWFETDGLVFDYDGRHVRQFPKEQFYAVSKVFVERRLSRAQVLGLMLYGETHAWPAASQPVSPPE